MARRRSFRSGPCFTRAPSASRRSQPNFFLMYHWSWLLLCSTMVAKVAWSRRQIPNNLWSYLKINKPSLYRFRPHLSKRRSRRSLQNEDGGDGDQSYISRGESRHCVDGSVGVGRYYSKRTTSSPSMCPTDRRRSSSQNGRGRIRWMQRLLYWNALKGSSLVCVKLDEKVVLCLSNAGRKMQIFHPIFTQPGKNPQVQPCTMYVEKWVFYNLIRTQTTDRLTHGSITMSKNSLSSLIPCPI